MQGCHAWIHLVLSEHLVFDGMAKPERLMNPPNAIPRSGGRLRSTDGADE